jgi:NarL family two-component system response regulator LiaR
VSRQPLRVAVISSHELIRAGLVQLLALDRARAVVVDAAAQDGHLDDLDVVIYDLDNLVDSTAGDLHHMLASDLKVVALQPLGRSALAEGALAAGVAAVVDIDVSGAELLTAVEEAATTETTRPDQPYEAHRHLVEEFGLTRRELDILRLIGSGISNQAIAAALYLSINSVKTYIRTAYRKIGATGRSQAVLWAVRHGLTPSGGGHGAPDQPHSRTRGG